MFTEQSAQAEQFFSQKKEILSVCNSIIREKKAFSYYLNGLSAQDEGEYAEALNNYYQALQIEEDLYDRSIILYNIGLIYSKNGDYLKALKYYYFTILSKRFLTLHIICDVSGDNDFPVSL